MTPESWALELLARLGAPQTSGNRAAVLAWVNAEGGHWRNPATHNPLNTTFAGYGGTSAGTSQKTVKKYPTWEDGLRATVDTLTVSRFAPEYVGILAALRAGEDGQAVVDAINGSPWGTSHTALQKRYDALKGAPMAKVVGGPVQPHVQAFADACQQATGQTSYGTYPGHDPSQDLALDLMCSPEVGDRIAEFCEAHWERFGVDYWIWRQRIKNPPDRLFWRDMADRGNPTQNHYDHVHISFNPTAVGPFDTPEEDELTGEEKAQLRYVKNAIDEIKSVFEGLAHGDEGGRDAWENGRRRFVMIQKAGDERSEAFMAKLDELLARTKPKG